jgi:predicted nuclease of predicted toxin-antitoxin system
MDENLGLAFYEIKTLGYDVRSVIEIKRGMTDEEVIKIAKDEDRIIITSDKDFGQLAQRYKPPGVVILRPEQYHTQQDPSVTPSFGKTC